MSSIGGESMGNLMSLLDISIVVAAILLVVFYCGIDDLDYYKNKRKYKNSVFYAGVSAYAFFLLIGLKVALI